MSFFFEYEIEIGFREKCEIEMGEGFVFLCCFMK